MNFSATQKGINIAPEAVVEYFSKATTRQTNTYTPVIYSQSFAFYLYENLYFKAELSDAKRKLYANSLSGNEFIELYDSLKARQYVID